MSQISFPHLLEEFKQYSSTARARVVYNRLLRAKKDKLAEKVAKKYDLDRVHCDRLTAFSFCLHTLKK